ncbi:DUF3626 domain-containing protein [Streptomyces sp. GZWMJZ-114]|uniref:DUF3626 domain-containing protein n=1 Tax=Streptomyces sp. GZWMJZ-114 TaxID=2494734 RepID=UPI0010132C01|nr:DUF3626 domain-containing protein [Streptomyces sp. GZWMJZ-114]
MNRTSSPPASAPLAAHARTALAHVAALAMGPALPAHVRVTLQFHPDRLTRDGTPVLERLAADGSYYSQYVTGTSNGGLTAYPGGDRHRWESRIFGGAYDSAPRAARPVYGALDDCTRGPVGAAPRFGSSYFRLRPETLRRATFCYPDSAAEPEDFGVRERCALLDLCRAGGRDPLDAYVETHVHGGVRLADDVEAVVLDAAYRGTPVEAAARRLPCAVEWHPGFAVEAELLCAYSEFRGPEIVALALEVAEDGRLDPRVIGDAVRAGRAHPQDLKKVWHCLARYGSP